MKNTEEKVCTDALIAAVNCCTILSWEDCAAEAAAAALMWIPSSVRRTRNRICTRSRPSVAPSAAARFTHSASWTYPCARMQGDGGLHLSESRIRVDPEGGQLAWLYASGGWYLYLERFRWNNTEGISAGIKSGLYSSMCSSP